MRIMRNVIAVALLSTAGGLFAISCGEETDQETLCEPGTNIFCRCRGGAAGTKQCLPDGTTFGPCESVWGPCDEIPPQPDGGTTTGTGGSGGSPPPPPPGELLAPCTTDAECQAGGMTCPMGYCTKPCASYEECTPPEPAAPGDCVTVNSMTVCVPYCTEQNDCAIYGEASVCSYTGDAHPPYDVVVCGNWGEPTLPPDTYPPDEYYCTVDVVCNLGLPGTERVCHDGACTTGCHQSSDCAGNECTSDSMDVLGTCGGGTSDPDVCPGEPITIAVSDGNVVRNGDTSELPLPDEAVSVAPCGNTSTPTEEWIYAVTPQQSGTLTVYVEPAASFDSQLYVRSGSCNSGTQVACLDEPGDGAPELVEVTVTSGQTVYVFVDGWDGSTGAFQLEMYLE